MKINAKRVWAALIALAMLLTIAPCAMAEVDKKEVVYVSRTQTAIPIRSS